MASTPPPLSPRPEGFPGQRLVVTPNPIVQQAALAPITRDLCITHIGQFTASKDHFVERPNGTPQHILIACLAGNGSCSLLGASWPIQAGDLLFLPPNQAHRYQAHPQSPWTIFWIHFFGERAYDYLHMLDVNPTNPILHIANLKPIFSAFEETFHHTTHGFNHMAMLGLTTSLSRLFGLIKLNHTPANARNPDSSNRLLSTLDAIRDNLAHPWSLTSLAHASGMSIPHFSHLCRQQTGLAPMALLIRLRLQHAMVLLQHGQCNVAEAAAAVGYHDPFYFSRLFKKHIGIPPSSCRNGP